MITSLLVAERVPLCCNRFPQSCIVVRFGPDLFPGIEGGAIVQWRCDCQVALSYIHANNMLMRFWGGIFFFHLKGDEQIELLAWLYHTRVLPPDMRNRAA